MEVVDIDKQWFLMFNMAMIAFSATLVVHVNCVWNSLQLYLKKSKGDVLIKVNLLQTVFAVSCHLCRLSDYFFITNCTIKAYYNIASYYASVTLMDILLAVLLWRLARGWRNAVRITWILCTVGFLFTVFKSLVIIDNVLSIKASVGLYAQCVMDIPVSKFVNMLGSEVLFHLCTLATLLILLAGKIKATGWKKAITTEFRYLIALDMSVILLYAAICLQLSTSINPEVFMQLKWALQSKAFNMVIEHYYKQTISYSNQNTLMSYNSVKPLK